MKNLWAFAWGVLIAILGSIPTIIMSLFKYKKQQKLKGIESEQNFLISMAVGSILGALIGSNLLRYVSSSLLYVILGIILFLSALKLANHKPAT